MNKKYILRKQYFILRDNNTQSKLFVMSPPIEKLIHSKRNINVALQKVVLSKDFRNELVYCCYKRANNSIS